MPLKDNKKDQFSHELSINQMNKWRWLLYYVGKHSASSAQGGDPASTTADAGGACLCAEGVAYARGPSRVPSASAVSEFQPAALRSPRFRELRSDSEGFLASKKTPGKLMSTRLLINLQRLLGLRSATMMASPSEFA